MMIEAKDWLLKMNSEFLTRQERAEFEAWLAEHPEHHQKYHLMSEVWNGADVLKDHPLTIRELLKSRELERYGMRRGRFTHFCFRVLAHWKPITAFTVLIILVAGIWFTRTRIDLFPLP